MGSTDGLSVHVGGAKSYAVLVIRPNIHGGPHDKNSGYVIYGMEYDDEDGATLAIDLRKGRCLRSLA